MNQKQFRVNTDSHGEVTLETKGKKGTYRVSFQHMGKHHRRSLKTSNKTVALERLPKLLAEYPVGVVNGFDSISFDQGLEYYIESLRAKAQARKDDSAGPAALQCVF